MLLGPVSEKDIITTLPIAAWQTLLKAKLEPLLYPLLAKWFKRMSEHNIAFTVDHLWKP